MSYLETFERAGAEILANQEFGDWQGTGLTKVNYKGKVGWIEYAYGSCSGCDAYEAELGYCWDEACDAHRYSFDQDCDDCQVRAEDYRRAQVAFALPYLETLYSQDEIEAAYAKRKTKYTWDGEAERMYDFVVANR